MNSYTKPSSFVESADYILNNSSLLIKKDCISYDGVLYERIGKSQYRFFFSEDDYDYLENTTLIATLDKVFEVIDAKA